MRRVIRKALRALPSVEVLVVIFISTACCIFSFFTSFPVHASIPVEPTAAPKVPREVWILYVGTWDNPETDGTWTGWDSKRDWEPRDPPDSIASVHYPELGAYSTHNTTTLKSHLQLLQRASVDVLVVPWDGLSLGNNTATFSDITLNLLFGLTPDFGLKLLPLFTSYDLRNLTSVEFNYSYYTSRYVGEKAHYRRGGKPVGLIYDADSFKAGAEFLQRHTEMAFFATGGSQNDYFGVFESGYLGFVTFGPSEDTSWASNQQNWRPLAAMSRERRIDFVPTVSPGFNGSAVGRWGFHGPKSRKCAGYYDARWTAAIDVAPDAILVHSFNSWHEGSAIEPVVERTNYTLSDDIWCGTEPDFFIKKTAEWVRTYKQL
jgi:glycoprotein endo-alpha-1,2-mannosidase